MEISALIFHFLPSNMSIGFIIVANNNSSCTVFRFYFYLSFHYCILQYIFLSSADEFPFLLHFLLCLFPWAIIVIWTGKETGSKFFSRREEICFNLSSQYVPHPWATMEIPTSMLCENSIVWDICCYFGVSWIMRTTPEYLACWEPEKARCGITPPLLLLLSLLY